MSHPRHRPLKRNPADLVRRQAKNQRRDLEDAARIVEFLRTLGEPSSAEQLRTSLAEGGQRFSSWRLRGLLRYLVLRRDAVEVRSAVPGRRTVLFQAAKGSEG